MFLPSWRFSPHPTPPIMPCFYRMDSRAVPLTCLMNSFPFPSFFLSFLLLLILFSYGMSHQPSLVKSSKLKNQGKCPLSSINSTLMLPNKSAFVLFLSHKHISYNSPTALPLERGVIRLICLFPGRLWV